MNDDILNWPLEFDGYDDMGVMCSHVAETRVPDRRCKAGYRVMRAYCSAPIGYPETITGLCQLVEAHARAVHAWMPPDSLCHEVQVAGDCGLPAGHPGFHDWEGR